jgi:acyl-CoA synthetase (NDP forming)
MFRSPAPLLQARTMAIVGASDRARWPVSIHKNLTETKSPVRIFPINPGRDEIWGMKCYPDFAALPEAPDLALIIIPAERIQACLEDGVRHGLKSALVYASGIGEGTDPEFHARGDALKALCEESGLVACGPNCMGNVSVREKLFVYPNPNFNNSEPGPVAGVFQSGGTLQAWSLTAAERGIRFSYLVSSGNELSLDAADYVNFFVDDPHTKLIVLMVEGIRRPEAFKEAARKALATGKPILAVKVGQTEGARQSARSHTGAIAGDYDVFAALCERYGIVLCPSLDDMLETALAFQSGRLPKGDGMAFMSNSGGVVDLMHDHAGHENVNMPPLSPATSKALRKLVGPDMLIQNPMDCGQAGFADERNYMRVCEAVSKDHRIHMVAFEARTPNAPGGKTPEPLRELVDNTDIPVFAFNRMGYAPSEFGRRFQEEAGIPHLQSMPETVRAMKALAFYGRRAGGKIPPLPKPRGKSASISPQNIEGALKAVGVTPPRSICTNSANTAGEAAQKIGFPVVLKIVSPDVSHKTEVGGVRLGLKSKAEVRDAARDLSKRLGKAAPKSSISGFLVQEMVAGVEMIVGVREDPLYGPVMVVGAGGILVELVKDTAFRMLPVNRNTASDMLDELAVSTLLDGFRGGEPADRKSLIDAICGLSKFFLDHRAWLADLEINPLIVRDKGKGVRAVDIRLIMQSSSG